MQHPFKFACRPPMNLAVPLLFIAALGCAVLAARAGSVKSPDGRLEAELILTPAGEPHYMVRLDGRPVILESKLGLIRDDADFSRALVLRGESRSEPVKDRYEIPTAKRRVNVYEANRKEYHLATASGRAMDVIFQVSNDGLAFRHRFPETSVEVRSIREEVSSFHFLPGTRAWLQPIAEAKSGWESTNPSYEEYYEQDIAVGTPSTLKSGWVFPALFRSGDTWLLVSETALGRNYCGSRLRHESPDGEYSIGFPDKRETIHGQPVNPSSSLPWSTPWRLVVVGSLKTIAESMMGVDLADKPVVTVKGEIKPGKASWSWPLLGDGSAEFDTQKRFIDYAAEMGWSYCLIDALWDKQIGWEKMQVLADYARGKKVGLLLWYNSNGDWNTAPQTPKNRLLTHEARVQEFTRLKAMGIRGLKVDFFGGDGQPMINLYHDLLEDSAAFGLLMNFHGATLPRGWQRTYPHLMTMEAIRGEEFVTFEQANADRQPGHAAMLPFTRNVFDPMDFTPVVLDKLPRGIQRRTTSAFELAAAVLFTSGIQHYAEIPEGLAKMPADVKDCLKQVPAVWDETKYLDGFPGKFVVLARNGDGRWFVAGINGEAAARTLSLDLGAVKAAKRSGTLITDGNGEMFQKRAVSFERDNKLEVTLQPDGGFVLMLD
jgi:hypothetical protein